MTEKRVGYLLLPLVALLGLLILATILPVTAGASTYHEQRKRTASDAQLLDNFGLSSSLSGSTAIAGAFHEDTLGDNAGAAYVYDKDQGGVNNWGQVKKLLASDAGAGDLFGWSVALNADTAVVGAPHEGGTDAGAAYIVQRNQGEADHWGEVTKLVASDAEDQDYFGFSVAIAGDTVVVGAPGEDGSSTDEGAMYVFQRDAGGVDNWGEVAKVVSDDAEAFDYFGWSVAVSGDTAVVGAIYEDSGAANGGAAYVFERDQGGANNWGQTGKLVASDAGADDTFGFGVSVDADTAVVGSVLEDAGGSDAGAAYVFGRDEGGVGNWGQVTKLTASDAASSDLFGLSVSIAGDNALVGAHHAAGGGSYHGGKAYVFQRDTGGADNWGEVRTLTESDHSAYDDLGRSVSVSGTWALLGANGKNGRRGAAYVYDLLAPKATPTNTPVPTSTPTPVPVEQMRLVVVDPPGACTGPTCQIDAGTSFTLGAEIVVAPGEGYIQAQSYVFFGPDITWPESTVLADDLVWPDCDINTAVRFQAVNGSATEPVPEEQVLGHGCASGITPPLPVSHYTGLFATMVLDCSAYDSSTAVELLAKGPLGTIQFTSGALFTLPPPGADQIIPVVHGLTIDCVTGG